MSGDLATVLTEAAAAIRAALAGVDGARVYADPGATLDPPALVPAAPTLTWEAYSGWPTSARWLIYLVAKADDRALPTLWTLLPAVTAALEGVAGAVVTQADPGTYQTGGVELPCYEITIEYAL